MQTLPSEQVSGSIVHSTRGPDAVRKRKKRVINAKDERQPAGWSDKKGSKQQLTIVEIRRAILKCPAERTFSPCQQVHSAHKKPLGPRAAQVGKRIQQL